MVSIADVARRVVHMPIARVGNEEAWKPEEVVYLAVRYLSGQCDGARRPDGVGFNRLDSDFGHRMANLPVGEWTPRQLWAARKLIAKYENTQLRFLKGLIPDIPTEHDAVRLVGGTPSASRVAPTGVRERSLRLATINGQRVVLIFHEWQGGGTELLRDVRAIPGVRWDHGAKRRVALITAETLDGVTNLIHKWNFHISDQDAAELAETVDRYAAAVSMSHAKDADLIIPGFGSDDLRAFPFQRAGIRYAMEKLATDRGVLVADEMGLGKTIQGLGIVQALDLYPFVVICPASLKKNWQREARAWLNGRVIAHLGTKLFSLNFMGVEVMCDGAVVNYNVQTLKKWKDELIAIRPKAIILDEMHNLKNGSAQQTKVVMEIVEQTGAKVIGLTGTPVVNKPNEFWQLAEILDQHHRLAPTFGQFMSIYGTTHERTLHELNLRARQHFMVRRLKRDVLPDLPPKLRDAVLLDLDNRAEYDAAEADLAHYYGTKKSEDAAFEAECRARFFEASKYVQPDGNRLEWDAFFRKMKRERYGSAYAVAAENEALMRWDILKQVAVKGKLAAAYEWIDTFLASTDQKIVLFIWHNEIGKAVAARYGADCINGDMKIELRQPAVDRFQNDPNVRVIVGNLQAMGEGLTLTAASTVAFLELGWNPKQMGQAEDRCHRIGQHDTVNVHWLVAENTIEDEIQAIIQAKMRLVDAIQDGPGIPTQGDVMRELAARLEKRMEAA